MNRQVGKAWQANRFSIQEGFFSHWLKPKAMNRQGDEAWQTNGFYLKRFFNRG